MGSKYFLCYLFLIIIIIGGCASSKPPYIPPSSIPVRYTVAELQTLADNGIYPMEILVDSMPIAITQKNPEYPDDARREGKEGTVWLRVLIGKDGVPKEVNLIKADGEKVAFTQIAINTAMEWRFRPAIVANQPVAYWVMIPFRFALGPKK